MGAATSSTVVMALGVYLLRVGRRYIRSNDYELRVGRGGEAAGLAERDDHPRTKGGLGLLDTFDTFDTAKEGWAGNLSAFIASPFARDGTGHGTQFKFIHHHCRVSLVHAWPFYGSTKATLVGRICQCVLSGLVGRH